MKRQLEEAGDSSCRKALLQFIMVFSAQMSPAGLETDVRHILALVLLAGRLDDPDPSLRLTAAELLIGTWGCTGSTRALFCSRREAFVRSGFLDIHRPSRQSI